MFTVLRCLKIPGDLHCWWHMAPNCFIEFGGMILNLYAMWICRYEITNHFIYLHKRSWPGPHEPVPFLCSPVTWTGWACFSFAGFSDRNCPGNGFLSRLLRFAQLISYKFSRLESWIVFSPWPDVGACSSVSDCFWWYLALSGDDWRLQGIWQGGRGLTGTDFLQFWWVWFETWFGLGHTGRNAIFGNFSTHALLKWAIFCYQECKFSPKILYLKENRTLTGYLQNQRSIMYYSVVYY